MDNRQSIYSDMYKEQVQDLINYHHEHHKRDELMFAVWYNRSNLCGNIYILEVYRNFPDPGQGRLETFEFGSSMKFKMKGSLKLIITSPSELRDADKYGDDTLTEIRKATDKKEYIFSEDARKLYEELVKGNAK